MIDTVIISEWIGCKIVISFLAGSASHYFCTDQELPK